MRTSWIWECFHLHELYFLSVKSTHCPLCMLFQTVLPNTRWHFVTNWTVDRVGTGRPGFLPTGTLLNLTMFYYIPLICLAGNCFPRQTCEKQITRFQKQNLSETIKSMEKSCLLLFNLWINPVVCWYCFLMLVLIIV